MNLFIYTGASRLNAAVVESATDLTPVSRLPDLIVGDSEPVTVKFLSASGAYESWSGGGTYTLSISIGALGADGVGAYFQTSSFTAVTNGWTGRLDLAASALRSAVGGYLADRPGVTGAPLTLQVRVTDASGNTETYARQSVVISGAVSVPTTADSTPVTYATAADVAADAATATAAAIAAAASASAASGSASTAAGHVTTAGNSATAAAASATTAGNSATTASGHATTATTQATNAATSASSASTYKDAAAVSAASATSSAGTATTQAALATTNGAAQVTLAAAQVTLATTQATNAGTSASAAAVSAAAALVSEAAALVSKNAAAASAATASAVSGSGNGTFSAAALTGVNSVTASASTPLTLTGGTSGASLVLGQGTTAADVTLAYKGTGKVAFNRWVAASATAPAALAAGSGGIYFQANGSVAGTQDSWVFDTGYTDQSYRFKVAGTDKMVIAANTGNLLIGTTTDAASLSGGLVINGSGAGAAASSTTTGALRVTGGVGVSGAGYFGGGLNVTSTAAQSGLSVSNTVANIPAIYLRQSNSASGDFTILNKNGGAGYTSLSADGGADVFQIYPTTGNIKLTSTTSASSSTVGALTIGNGTATANVAIGGGNIVAGNVLSVMSSTPTLPSAGTRLSMWYDGGQNRSAIVSYDWTGAAYKDLVLDALTTRVNNATSASNSYTGSFVVGNGSAGSASVNVAIGGGNVNAGGTLVVGGTVIHTLSATPASASATGTVGTMSWDANYIYICTATNTWKRVAIATW